MSSMRPRWPSCSPPAGVPSPLYPLGVRRMPGNLVATVPTSRSADPWPNSEIPFPLLLLHRPRLVMIDDPPLPFGVRRQQHLLDDLRQCRRVALDRSGERVAAQRAEPHPL